MARGLGVVLKTKKCNCKNPKWSIVHKRKVTSGKQYGKIIYTLSCSSCGNQWETPSKYAEELERK